MLDHEFPDATVPRFVARLDVKGPNVIKGIQFEGLRVMGDPAQLAERYYQDGAQELLFIDTVASLYGRNNLTSLVEQTVQNVFIPLTVGGGIQSVEHARGLLSAGADKVALNTAAVKRPELLRELAEEFGSQCVVLSIQAKKAAKGWEALTEAGREHSGRDVLEWLQEATECGAGEVLITSVDKDGTGTGFDVDLLQMVSAVSRIPVVASGGYGTLDHIRDLLEFARPEGVAIARAAHTGTQTFGALREHFARGTGDSW
jgi:cyclase